MYEGIFVQIEVYLKALLRCETERLIFEKIELNDLKDIF
ncbi:hypothetical protein SD77_2979 [Bacillus badius]|uniref:Uncharacterized protein n=1 Tax=Bacillus badius TaxID=1455 RepID=A0ABR5AP55_BACBA|nr:hypothetical protein SD77_2979 [Bacillus badius]